MNDVDSKNIFTGAGSPENGQNGPGNPDRRLTVDAHSAPPAAAGTVRLRFLGSGDNFGSGGRFQACIHVDTGATRFLMDCGASSLIPMKRAGISTGRDRSHPGLPPPRGPFRRHPLFHP